MKTIAVIVGTRPECIKMAPLILELRKQSAFATQVLCTGQQRDLCPQALGVFGLSPDCDLDVMQANQSLSGLTSRILTRLEARFETHRPDLVLCHGDTTTAFAAALSCQYHQLPVVHVESGLRTHNLMSPFPEEFNRTIIAAMAMHHFAPTSVERQNLLNEGIAAKRISVVGNTLADAVAHFFPTQNEKQTGPFRMVATLHRRETDRSKLTSVLETLRGYVVRNTDVTLTFPMHPNPTVHHEVERVLFNTPGIQLLPPLAYPQFLNLLMRASLVLTDSGGVQEEASLLKRPTFVLRTTTERRDGLDEGLVRLVDPACLELELEKVRTSPPVVFGLGNLDQKTGAARAITQELLQRLIA